MSTLKVNDIVEATQGGGKIWPARAWVCFTSSGTVTINDDGNVSSLTDNGVGLITANFSNSLASANYCQTGQGAANNSDTSTLRGAETVKDYKLTSSMRNSYQNGLNTSRYDSENLSMQ